LIQLFCAYESILAWIEAAVPRETP
jgi:hypothetical protein